MVAAAVHRGVVVALCAALAGCEMPGKPGSDGVPDAQAMDVVVPGDVVEELAGDVLTPTDAPLSDVVGVDARFDVSSSRDVGDTSDVADVTDRGVVTDVAAPMQYLEVCRVNADCSSGDCVATGGAGFCTRRCTTQNDCGDGYLCAVPAGGSTGRCLPDDTGLRCDPASASSPCARLCFGNSATRVGHCTHECAGGSDCPAGFACSPVGSTSVCVEVERPCMRAADCASNFCLGPSATFSGCSAQCRTSADCPRRFTINDSGRLVALPPYQCQSGGDGGVNLCVPPFAGLVSGGDVLGTDPIGSSCSASGTVNCYSGVCDTGTPGDPFAPASCVQTCTPAGGCPIGFRCSAWLPDGPVGGVYLVCRPAGAGAVGTACSRNSDCATALCEGVTATMGYCTRFCNDRYCPTGMRCSVAGTSVDGTQVSLCLR